MPFSQPTPESMLGRADSKNPASTCRGITSNGTSCRRAIAKNSINNLERGVYAVVSNDSGRLSDAAFYCWQHKDQARNFVQANNAAHGQNHTTVLPILERTSIDSLVARLGVASLSDNTKSNGRPYVDQRKQHPPHHAHEFYNRPEPPRPQYQRPIRPAYTPQPHPPKMPPPPQQRRRHNPGFWTSLCCIMDPSDDGDHYEIVRHRQRTEGIPRPEMSYAGPHIARPRQTASRLPNPAWDQRRIRAPDRSYDTPTRKTFPSQRHPLSELPIRPSNLQSSSSHTQTLLSYIPRSLSPQKTSILLTELSKPISPNDEAGYIYIFWLTPDTHKLPKETASRILPPSATQPHHRLSDIVSDHSGSSSSSNPKTIKLKIGRANNVHRRMTEWTRQCGYDLNLVRWYPYVPSSPTSSPQRLAADAQGVRKVPHAHRVERLVHLELAERRVKQLCGACGKEHREWFEVEASEEGVRAVDEVVRRWVRWAEEREGSENLYI
ncbi:hypothetical protein MBLNU457_5190t1 [Dothideomycetes sp. NU457]